MVLRKCPACKEMVGTESYICPRCGVRWRTFMIRRVVVWTAAVALAGWAVQYVWRAWF